MTRAAMAWAVLTALVACGGGDATTDGGGDASPLDAGHRDAATDAEPTPDASAPDASVKDSAAPDGAGDAATADGGSPDAGSADAGRRDAGDALDAALDAGPDIDASMDAGPDGDPDGDSFPTRVERACGTDPLRGDDFPEATELRGSGTEPDPYRLCWPEHLALFAAAPSVTTAHARVGRDLDFEGIAIPPSIGTIEAPYAGTFDGAGHRLSNLAIGTEAEPRKGLFGVLGAAGQVRDLHLDAATAYGGSPLAGDNRGTIARVSVEATVVAPDHVGVLLDVNRAGGVVRDSASAGSITTSASHVGGLVGQNDGLIERCSSAASVTSQHRSGGLVGSGSGTVRRSFASGAVTCRGFWIGGLVGTARDGARIEDSYAVGDVSAGMDIAGGLVGNAEGTAALTRVYAQNTVTGASARGILGEDSGGTASVSLCYFDQERTATDDACAGRSAAEMGAAGSFGGFDFTTPVWVIDPTVRASPILAWQ